MTTKVKGEVIKENSIPLSALSPEVKNKIENAGGGGSSATPDWNAQEGEAGYIKNKTHGATIFVRIEYDQENNKCKYEVSGFEDKLLLLWRDTYFTVHKNTPLTIDVNDGEDTFIVNYNGTTLYITDNNGYLYDEHEYISVSETNIPLAEAFLPNTVLKTTPQTLSDTDKNQVKENLGLGEVATKQELTELSTEVGKKVDADKIATINGQSLVNGGTDIVISGGSGDSPIVKGEIENSAIFNGEVQTISGTYKNRAISQTAIALGGNTLSGLKGYYITYIDFDTNEIWVHNERPQSDLKVKFEWETKPSTNANKVQYSAGGFLNPADNISIICNGRHYNCGEIKSISGNKIVLKESLPFTQTDVDEILDLNSSITNINRYDELTLFVISKPHIGPVDLGGTSLSEGLDSKAIGGTSHAEGYQTIAYGKYAHTEGYQTEAGYNSHSEGYLTKALGERSHAEGRENIAEGNYSHAEGRETSAVGNFSHTEGYKTKANGGASHAEGSSTEAGENAHSEGLRTKALGENSHSEGKETIADGDQAHAEGTNTTASKFAHAEGWSTTASGDASHSEGSTTTASGPSSHAEGYTTTASGDNSHAEGESTEATNYNAHAEGKSTVASGDTSHAEGQETQAIGTASHAEGVKTKASDWASHVEGYNCETGGNAEVNDKEADEDEIEGQMAHAEGNSTIARGNASHAEGTLTLARGKSSHAEGLETQATGKYSHAQNYKTQAIGIESHAEGSRTKAYGATSHAEGYLTETRGENSHGEGEFTKTTNNNEHAQGQYNVSNSGKTIHSVGIGTSDTNRKNAHEITIDGKHYILGVGDYTGTTTEGATDLAAVIENLITEIGLIKEQLGIE